VLEPVPQRVGAPPLRTEDRQALPHQARPGGGRRGRVTERRPLKTDENPPGPREHYTIFIPVVDEVRLNLTLATGRGRASPSLF
jgi:hypothetical protein